MSTMKHSDSSEQSLRRSRESKFSLIEDEAFCKFFRVPMLSSSEEQKADTSRGDQEPRVHDRLSLLACQRQGFVAKDLMHAPRGMFVGVAGTGGGSSSDRLSAQKGGKQSKILDAVQDSKFHAHQMRRQQFLQIAERERKTIVTTLLEHQLAVEDAQERNLPIPRMDHFQQVLHTELMTQVVDSRSNDAEESHAISSLLLRESDNQAHRSRVKTAVQKTKDQGEKEIEKIKNRQIRSITNDLQLETQREEIYSKLQAAERQWKEDQERRNAVLHRKSVLAARKREYKVLMLQHRQEELSVKKKSALNQRVERRERLEEQITKQKEEELHRRTQQSEAHMQYVKKQAELVREEEMSKCRLLQHEQEAKLSLHAERRKNLHLRLETAKQLRTIESQKRHNNITAFQARKQTDAIDQSEAIDKRIEEANVKKHTHDTEKQELYRSIQDEHQRSVEEAEYRRNESQQKREVRNREILNREYEKELLIDRIREEEIQKQELMKAKNREKREQHLHNMERIRRLGEYRQQVKDAKLAEDLAHQEEQSRRKKEMAQRLAQARQNVAEGKERVINKFLKLRSSPQWSQMDPKEVIEKELGGKNKKDKKTGSQKRSNQREAPPPPSSPSASSHSPESSCSRSTSSGDSRTSLSSTSGDHSRSRSTSSSSRDRSRNTPLDEMIEKLRKEKE